MTSFLMPSAPTLRDHFAATLHDTSSARFQRLCALIVDRRPLGDHPLNIPRTKEELKAFEELQWLGIALVGCDADLEIQHVRYTGSVPGMPDFEALTTTGNTIRIELARIVFGAELEQDKLYASIAASAQAELESISSSSNSGEYVYRAYNAKLIGRKDTAAAGKELADFIRHETRLLPQSTTLFSPGDPTRFPVLCKLGIHVSHSKRAGTPVSVLWDPMSELSNKTRAFDQFEAVRMSKVAKYARYSGGGALPVWLALAATSLRQRFVALSLIEYLAGRDDVDPRPFERILVGCYTAGVTFSHLGERPRYTSLTTTG